MFERDELLKISIRDYLDSIGIPTRKEGNRYFCSSPFSSDRNWSFCIYPTNTYFDFSSGHGGNLINLVSRLHNVSITDAAKIIKEGLKYEKYKPNYKVFKTAEYQRSQAPFDYKKYINTDPEECKKIKAYAASRRIEEGYFCGIFFSRNQDVQRSGKANGTGMERERISLEASGKFERLKWKRNPSLSFLHVDKDLKPCGIKFRRITPQEGSNDQSARFSARGNLGFYIPYLEKDISSNATVYVVESETSANSLYSFLKKQGRQCIVLSRGGVSSHCSRQDLPEAIQNSQIKLIIDYDGNEELYQQRLRLYEELKAEPIKLELPKNEDINSLYCQGKMHLIEHLL